MALINIRLLRPRFENGLDAQALSAEILAVAADGKEIRLDSITLRHEEHPGSFEPERLLEKLARGQLEEQHRCLILDLGALEKVDSSGVGEIVAARRLASEAGAELVLANLRPKVRDILRRTEIDRMLPVCNTIGDAVHYFQF